MKLSRRGSRICPRGTEEFWKNSSKIEFKNQQFFLPNLYKIESAIFRGKSVYDIKNIYSTSLWIYFKAKLNKWSSFIIDQREFFSSLIVEKKRSAVQTETEGVAPIWSSK